MIASARSPGSHVELETVRGYYVDYRDKTLGGGGDERRLLPVALAQRALGWWERWLSGESDLEQFRRYCRVLERSAQRVDGEARWWYRVPVTKYRLHRPWCSAMAQGQIASVFVRAYLADGDDRHAALALEALEPLHAEDRSDLVTLTSDGPILEEAPSRPASHILNGWVYALFGLLDVELALHDRRAADLYVCSVSCLRRRISDYDVGWWTRYSLYPHRTLDLAKPYYHRLHTQQAAILHRLTGSAEFADAARRWASYDRRRNVAAALAHKAVCSPRRLVRR